MNQQNSNGCENVFIILVKASSTNWAKIYHIVKIPLETKSQNLIGTKINWFTVFDLQFN